MTTGRINQVSAERGSPLAGRPQALCSQNFDFFATVPPACFKPRLGLPASDFRLCRGHPWRLLGRPQRSGATIFQPQTDLRQKCSCDLPEKRKPQTTPLSQPSTLPQKPSERKHIEQQMLRANALAHQLDCHPPCFPTYIVTAL